jgi:hypothetical protein
MMFHKNVTLMRQDDGSYVMVNGESFEYAGPVSMMKGGGGGGSTTTVQQADPWSGVQGYLSGAYGSASGLYNSGQFAPTAYSGNTVAAPSADTTSALNMTRTRAAMGSPLVGAAQNEAMSTLSGDYLGAGNPYLANALAGSFRPAAEAFRDATMPAIESRAALSGRYGSGAMRGQQDKAYDALGRTFSEAATNAYSNNYQQERARQQAAMGYAPTLAAEDYKDAEKLAAVGEYTDQYNQSKINEDIARYEQNRDAPYTALSRYLNMLQGGSNLGGTTSSTQSGGGNKSNPLLGAAGGAATGFQLAGPWGAAAGGLLGLFG